MESMKEEKPVLYPEGKMVDCVEAAAKEYPDRLAYEFMGRKCTYTGFIKDVEKCAKALVAIGVKEDDVVCISMPNVPQAITFLYAANKIGAVVNMIHPLSSEGEMVKFINSVEAKTILLMDQFYGSIKNIRNQTPLKNVIVAGIEEALPPLKRLLCCPVHLPKKAGLSFSPPHAPRLTCFPASKKGASGSKNSSFRWSKHETVPIRQAAE